MKVLPCEKTTDVKEPFWIEELSITKEGVYQFRYDTDSYLIVLKSNNGLVRLWYNMASNTFEGRDEGMNNEVCATDRRLVLGITK